MVFCLYRLSKLILGLILSLDVDQVLRCIRRSGVPGIINRLGDLNQ